MLCCTYLACLLATFRHPHTYIYITQGNETLFPNWKKESWQTFEETSGYGSTSGPTPWQIDDDDDDELFTSQFKFTVSARKSFFVYYRTLLPYRRSRSTRWPWCVCARACPVCNFVLMNFLQSVIMTWLTHEILRWVLTLEALNNRILVRYMLVSVRKIYSSWR